VPARYYVQGLQTIFLAGDIGSVLWPCSAALSLMGGLLFLRTAFATKTRLD
jgi:ABC-2 type transport system permease protein